MELRQTKDLEHFTGIPFRYEIIHDEEEGGYTVTFPELPGCLTCVENIEDIEPMAEDAKKAWLEAAIEEGLVLEIKNNLAGRNNQL